MKYIVVSANEFTYPDIFEYPSQSDRAELHAPRNSFASAQILVKDVPEGAGIQVKMKGGFESLETEWYEMVPVFVEDNPWLNKENATPNCPNRWAPFYIYDCLKPLQDTLTVRDGCGGLYFAVRVRPDAKPGVVEGEAEIRIDDQTLTVPIRLTIYKATVPLEESLKIIIGYNSGITARYHNVPPGSAEHQELDKKYLQMLRRMRQNMLYVPGGVKVQADEKGRYSFDFSPMVSFVKFAISLGFKYFNAPSVGGRKSWKQSTILVGPGLEAMSFEGYQYLSQYLPALRRVILENGWIDCFYMGVSDEPNEANETEFRALCGLVRKFFPEIKLIDAASYGNIHGSLDVYVPLNSEYQKHQRAYESYRENGDEIWHYVCCVPRSEGYINRFMDYPLLSTRYLYWGNYKYNLAGYLHWAANFYQPGQDPFSQNCPRHRNADSETILPPGDTHLIYPGQGEPWMSIRLEAHRQSAEEYELFRLLEKEDKALADSICEKGFRSFKDVEYDPVKFESIRIELLKAVSGRF